MLSKAAIWHFYTAQVTIRGFSRRRAESRHPS